jgi:SM-20-related protein
VGADGALRGAGVHAGLRTEGIAVCDRFLTSPQVQALVDCAQIRRERGDFAPARIGADRNLQRREEVRGDSICWLADPLFAPERELFGSLEDLRLQLNRGTFLGLFELEMHYAWYPPGAGYARHVDQPQCHEQRRVSLVLYLNERWEASDGGELRYFADNERYRDIEPVGGRLVAFLTERREHAVMPTRRPRLSLSGWFRSRENNPLR